MSRTGDPNDRRSRLAVLTEAGRAAYARGSEIKMQAERELFGVLTASESDKLLELLGKLQQ